MYMYIYMYVFIFSVDTIYHYINNINTVILYPLPKDRVIVRNYLKQPQPRVYGGVLQNKNCVNSSFH